MFISADQKSALIARSMSDCIPRLVTNQGQSATYNFIEFFVASIRNPNTRLAYHRAAVRFLEWADSMGIPNLSSVDPIHVATWVELDLKLYGIATVKQRLAGIKMLFDWLVVRQIIPVSPAASVRSPRHIVRKGKTSALEPSEARQLIDAIDTSKIIGLRDRALIGTMIYSFARIGAALAMTVEDVYTQNRRLWIRLQEKGGKQHDMPCHHELEEWMHAYIDSAELNDDPKGWLFRSIDRNTKQIGTARLSTANAYMMVKRRSLLAGIETEISNHSFRATGITAYLLNGGTIEKAARMANHASTRTTQLYDRRDDAITLSEIERVRF